MPLISYTDRTYRLCGPRVRPGFQLYNRLRIIRSLYPQPMESFLDIGSCRGYYVMDAAQRSGCKIATGIDVHEPFIITALKVRDYLGIANCDFHLATMDKVADSVESYGGPFQTVLLVGTYHYLYWGSRLSSSATFNHRDILERLWRISTEQVLLSGRHDICRLPGFLREKAESVESTIAEDYTTVGFLNSAAEFFDVRKSGYLGKYPLYTMLRKSHP